MVFGAHYLLVSGRPGPGGPLIALPFERALACNLVKESSRGQFIVAGSLHYSLKLMQS